MAKEFKEKTITVNLRKAFEKPATKRAICAKNMLKKAVEKETRKSTVKLSNQVNETIWARGRGNTPRKIIVKIISEKEKALVMLPSEKYEPKDKKKEAAKKEEKKTESKPAEAEKAKETPAKETPKQSEKKAEKK